MECFNRKDQFRYQNFGFRFCQRLRCFKVATNISFLTVVHKNIELIVALETRMHFYQKRMLEVDHDLLLNL